MRKGVLENKDYKRWSEEEFQDGTTLSKTGLPTSKSGRDEKGCKMDVDQRRLSTRWKSWRQPNIKDVFLDSEKMIFILFFKILSLKSTCGIRP